MKKQNLIARPLLPFRLLRTLVLASSLIGVIGCSKQLANFRLNQSTSRVEEARLHKADEFDLDGLNSVQSQIDTARQYFNQENFSEASARAKDAATQAKALLERTKNRRAGFLRREADDWIAIMDTNQGRREDAIGYERIIELKGDGQGDFDGEKWEPAIEKFDKVIADVEILLGPLKRKAQDGLADIDQMRQELLDEGAQEHRPEAIIEIESFHDRVDSLIVDDNDYLTAIETRDAARLAAAQGITKTKEIKSNKLLTQIEQLLDRAVASGAEVHARESLVALADSQDQLLTHFYETNFDTVLATGPPLIPRAHDLIVETKRNSAQSQIKTVDGAIEGLTAGQARIYLPGSVERLEELRGEAQRLFDSVRPQAQEWEAMVATYTQTEETCLSALEEEKRIIDEFDSLAMSAIGEASAKLNIAEGVFSRMEEIFTALGPGPNAADDVALRNRRESLREELRARVLNANVELGVSTLKREDKVFHEAIEIARDIQEQAEEVTQATYRVVAENAIQGVGNELTRYERGGGREYAPEETSRAEAMLVQTRQLVEEGQYREASELAAATKAQVEILAQELERVYQSKVEDAGKSRELARAYGAGTYEEDRLRQVDLLLREAEGRLDAEALDEAIQLAEEAALVAGDAGNEALRQWALDEIRRTDITLARALEAGADGYAPALVDEAINLRRSAENLIQAGNLVEGQSLASQAAQTIENALYAEVIQGEEEVALAMRYEGWKYETDRLAQAMINSKYAREFMDQGDFRNASSHARHAIETGREVASVARKASFRERISALQAKVSIAEQKGPGFYQVRDLSDIVAEIPRLIAEFEPEGFEDATERIELLEARLQRLFETTPDVLNNLVEDMNDRLTSLEERGARGTSPDLLAEASGRIRAAQVDFIDGRFRTSFLSVRDAITLFQKIELELDERDFDRQVGEFFMEFSDILDKFSPVLNMGSGVLMRMVQGPTGRSQAIAILSASNPADFRQDVGDLGTRMRLLEPPETRIDVAQATLEMIGVAKEAASGFEKMLILDQYSLADARKIIQTAFLQMRQARSAQHNIQRMLETPTTRAEIPGVQRALQVRP